MPDNLRGIQFASFESRQAAAMKSLIEKQGGSCFSVPTVQEIPIAFNDQVAEFAEKLMRDEIDIIVLLTGVGTRKLMELLQSRQPIEAVLEAFQTPVLVARGPKPVKALSEYGLKPTIRVPEPNTWKEVIAEIEKGLGTSDLIGKTIAVQEYGISNDRLVDGLKERGAEVLQVPVYRWALPDDIGPMLEAIDLLSEGKIHVSLFTSAVQIHHMFKVAAENGSAERLKEGLIRTVVASIGPMCSEAIRSYGIKEDFEAKTSTMGAFILQLSEVVQSEIRKKCRNLN